jgi:AraC family transcriptional regulator, arabinose operon regulatory protein
MGSIREADAKLTESIWKPVSDMSQASPLSQQPVDLRVRAVIEFLSTAEDLSILDCGMIGQRVHLSGSRLRHLFKQHVGFSLQCALKLIKLQKATILLRHSYLTVKEIGAKAGFNDASHFVRDFKKVYGLRPSEFRLQGDHCLKRPVIGGNANK